MNPFQKIKTEIKKIKNLKDFIFKFKNDFKHFRMDHIKIGEL